MELDHDHELRRGFEEEIQELEGAAHPPLTDGVEERPRGSRHDFGNERLDIVHADGRAGPVERELLELRNGELALPAAVDVALADESADPCRHLACGTGFQ